MRLTLRTLLAYLDDTLEPAQARLIGLKVAESDTAQELIARIKQVTRRRRLTTPPAGPGSKLDANMIAEYLDNSLAPDQLAEVEQTCLGSDVHLAEIAACHQILTLVLGEPALIPPTSRQRMYALVKGPEAIPFRRPAGAAEESDEGPDHNHEADDTLRLGLPAYRGGGSWSSRLTLVGGALAAALLLALAIWQAVRLLPSEPDADLQAQGKTDVKAVAKPSTREKVSSPEATSSGTHDKGGHAKSTEVAKSSSTQPSEPKQTAPEAPKKGGEKTTKPETKAPNESPTPQPGHIPGEVPVEPPLKREREVGKFQLVAADGGGLLLERQGAKDGWRMVSERAPQVHTHRPLVSLPGYRSLVQLNSGLRLTLWGNLPEQAQFPPSLRESLVELHDHPDLDLDMTLRRGRIVLNNSEKKPLRARVRWDNPTNPKMPETWDLALEPGAEVLMDLWGYYTRDEPFYPVRNHTSRRGPVAALHMIVTNGALSLHRDMRTVRIEAEPPKASLVLWSSFKGASERQTIDSVPSWATTKPQLPQGVDLRSRERMNTSLRALATLLGGSPDKISTGLAADFRYSTNVDDAVLAVRCFGAIDDLPSLIDALGDGERREVRAAAMDTLRNWIAAGRDNDYILLDELDKKKYLKVEAVIMMTLLHSFSEQQASDRNTYELLIDYLDNPKLAIRELAAWHLYGMAGSVGASIGYSATASSETRVGAQMMWRKLVSSGKLPPAPAGPPAGS